jgi:threonylcarbamoyladenosine tRNA methylthiotransferase MtaB
VDDELLRTWVDGAPRTLPHVHLPLQSGDDGVLRRMGRRYTADDYARTVERVRAAIPGVAVHADVIAGFPTEDDDTFARSVAFIRDLDLAGLHVFRYSARPGTPATRMVGQVSEHTRKQRAAELLALGAGARAAFARRSLGTTTRALVERHLPDGRWTGHGEDHVLVVVEARHADPPDLENAILTVRRTAIDGELGERVTGEILEIHPAPRGLRTALPVMTRATAASMPNGGAHAR